MDQLTHPLSGIKVVEMASYYSGPMAGMLLAELGAEVTKVESPSNPDFIRAGSSSPGPTSVNATFYALNRGKRFCAIDGKSTRGRALLAQLVTDADVFLHNMRPGKPEALGLGYDELSARNPGLIYAAVSGLGSDGPESQLPVYDFVIQAKVGMIEHQQGLSSERRDLVRQVVIDKTTSNAAVQGVLAALFMRERTGVGQRVDISMVGTALAFFWPDGMGRAHSVVDPSVPPDDLPRWVASAPGSFLVVLPTLDGEVATGLLLPTWPRLCRAIDREDLMTDERFATPSSRMANLPALLAEAEAAVASMTTEQALARFAEQDYAIGAVADRTQVQHDVTVGHLGLLSEQEAKGLGPVRQPKPMWSFGQAEANLTTSIGPTGADSVAVLTDLGLDQSEIDDLLADGVVMVADGSAPPS